MPTIRDIAKAAGVSVATVSRIINHKDSGISEETRSRVLQIIQEYDYVPYAKLRDRLLATTNTIALALPTLESGFYASFLSHIQTLARENSQSLIVSITGGDPDVECAALDSFTASKTDGILFFPGSRQGLDALEQIQDSGTCAVILDHAGKNARYPQVYRDRSQITRACTELLLRTHMHAALILRANCGVLSDQAIISGYESALRLKQIPLNSHLIIHADEALEQSFDTLIELGIRGFVCQDPETAAKVSVIVNKKRLSIPKDLSLISLEDSEVASQLSPTLTCAATDPREMAQLAYHALSSQICQQASPFTVHTVPYTLVFRDSLQNKLQQADRIVIVGSMNMDIIIQMSHLPRFGETLVADQLTVWPGGKGANQALGVSRLGGHAHMLGCLGNDLYGRQVYAQLTSANVNMSNVVLSPDLPTGTAYVNVCPDGNNSIAVHLGANSHVNQEYIRLNGSAIRKAKFCLVQTEIPIDGVTETLKFCKQHQVRVILKPSPARSLPPELLNGLFMLIPNREEMNTLCPDISDPALQARHFLDMGVENVIITLGADGCLWASGEKSRYFPARPYPCVDSTGASDVFISCLAVMLSEDRSIEDAINAAVWAASYSVTQVSVQDSIPTRQFLDQLMQSDIPRE